MADESIGNRKPQSYLMQITRLPCLFCPPALLSCGSRDVGKLTDDHSRLRLRDRTLIRNCSGGACRHTDVSTSIGTTDHHWRQHRGVGSISGVGWADEGWGVRGRDVQQACSQLLCVTNGPICRKVNSLPCYHYCMSANPTNQWRVMRRTPVQKIQ